MGVPVHPTPRIPNSYYYYCSCLKPLCGHTIRAKLCLTFFWFPCSPSGTRVRLYFRSVNNSEARLKTPLENLIEDSGTPVNLMADSGRPMKIWCRRSDGRFWAPKNSGNRIFGSFSGLNNHFISYSHFFRSHGSYFGMKNCDNLPLNVKCVAEIDKIDQQSIIKLTPCNSWQIYSSLLTYSASQLDWGW